MLDEVHSVLAMSPKAAEKPSQAVEKKINELLSQAESRIPKLPVIDSNQKNEFRALWKKSLPVMVKNVDVSGVWKPDFFSRTYGEEDVRVVGTAIGRKKGKNMPFKQFLELWRATAKDGRTADLRVSTNICSILVTVARMLNTLKGLAY